MIERHESHFLPICYYIGIVMMGLGLIQYIPLATSLIYHEWDILWDFVISSSIALLVGGALMFFGDKSRSQKLGWGEGMVVAAGSWLMGMLLSAIPYLLSGNYLSYLDCCFDVMSGFTTTGVVLIQDLDHVSNGINMWRHLITFVGGQGMVVLALTFLVKGTNGAYKMYVGEAKDERLMPNTVSTARAIWLISLIYLCVGTLFQWIAGMMAGLSVDRAFLHGLWVFMAAWSTGGFAPMTQNILYYHSTFYELVTLVFFIIGSFNFALHYAAMTGKKRELIRNVETVSFTVTVTVLTLIATLGLLQSHVYPDAVSMFRKGFYQLISGHTTTGFMTVYARQFYHEWGDVALFAIIVAMLIGGSACSTAGGFKGLRMGILFHAFKKDIKRMVMPESMVSVERYHHINDVLLEDNVARSALLIVMAYIVTFTLGTLAGMLCGYSFGEAAFEAASVTGNVGLSIGVTSAAMPAVLKVTYIIIMWLARLEFMSILALGVYIATKVKKEMSKIMMAAFLVMLCFIPVTALAADGGVTSTDLIEHAKDFDGLTIVYEGEVIGDIMRRGGHTWINVSDGSNAVGIWAANADMQGIDIPGRYGMHGDKVKVTGVFYRACAEHGGDFDIHASGVELLQKGYPVAHTVLPWKTLTAMLLLAGAMLCMAAVVRKNRRR